jgi:TonB family protein
MGLSFGATVLHLDDLSPRTPHLPYRRLGALPPLAVSAALHVTLAAAAGAVYHAAVPGIEAPRSAPAAVEELRHLVFIAPALPRLGGGGGGGGNRQSGPIRRAQGVGSDPVTLRVRKPLAPAIPEPAAAAPAAEAPSLASLVLDAKPLASGLFDQIGLPTSAMFAGTSTGPGSGGGVGTGTGTGIGSGRGPGLGPGSGGGTGGGVYRPGGAVSAPRVLKEVKPKYPNEALRRLVQGTVVVELVVTRDGLPSQIRVIRSLDPGGLDDEAVAAVTQWRFEPGRLSGTPVDVMVTIMLDFWIR